MISYSATIIILPNYYFENQFITEPLCLFLPLTGFGGSRPLLFGGAATAPEYYNYFVNNFAYFYIMKQDIDIIKGIHPGFYLDRKIQEQHLKKGQLALAVNEYPQTLTTITKGKRDMNTTLALKLEKALGLEEGTLMILQVYYDIAQVKKKQNSGTPDLRKLRPVIFWDSDMNAIDWHRQYRAVIRRVFERGNEREKNEITKFYGKDKVDEVLSKK